MLNVLITEKIMEKIIKSVVTPQNRENRLFVESKQKTCKFNKGICFSIGLNGFIKGYDSACISIVR